MKAEPNINTTAEAALPMAGQGPVSVWIIEDNRPLRETLAEVVDGDAATRCTLAAEGYEEALEALARGEVPQVVLSDLELPGMDGIEGIGRIKTQSPATHVVVLTIHEDDDRVFNALCAGATGYLLKPASGERIVEAIQTALSGGAPMNAFIASKVLRMFTRYTRPAADYGLTDREREILHLLVEEHTQREVAEALFLSPHTVDTHLRNIYAKLQVHSRTGAVAKALRERLL
jgi:DNA-binding NarL/FixJ family response regulator